MLTSLKTRQPSHHKDDHAMRPKYGCPENVRDFLTTPMAIFFPKFLMDFVPVEPKNGHAKFEVHSFTRSSDNSGYPEKLGSHCICPRSLFSNISKGL